MADMVFSCGRYRLAVADIVVADTVAPQDDEPGNISTELVLHAD